jgi:glucosamine-phosphate N-acetyltransferase
MSKVWFRCIEKADLDEVFILLNQLKEIDLVSVEKQSAWDSFVSNPSSNSIVGVFNKKIVAYGSIVIENKIRGEVAGHIEDIVVDKEVRGKMVGVSLIKELVAIAKKKGCYRITLFCKEKLEKFYSRNGFRVDSILMKKYID